MRSNVLLIWQISISYYFFFLGGITCTLLGNPHISKLRNTIIFPIQVLCYNDNPQEKIHLTLLTSPFTFNGTHLHGLMSRFLDDVSPSKQTRHVVPSSLADLATDVIETIDDVSLESRPMPRGMYLQSRGVDTPLGTRGPPLVWLQTMTSLLRSVWRQSKGKWLWRSTTPYDVDGTSKSIVASKVGAAECGGRGDGGSISIVICWECLHKASPGMVPESELESVWLPGDDGARGWSL